VAVKTVQQGQNSLGRGGMSEGFFQTGDAFWGYVVGRGVVVRHVVSVEAVCGHMRRKDSCDRGAVVGIVPGQVCARHARGEI
jgi:hypothetical protein